MNPPRQLLLAEAIARLTGYAYYTTATVSHPGDNLPTDAIRYSGEAMATVNASGAVTIAGAGSPVPVLVPSVSTGLRKAVLDKDGFATLDYTDMAFADVPRLSVLPPLTIDLVPTSVLVAVPTNKVAKLQVRKLALLAGLLSAAGDPGATVYWGAIQRP